MFGTIDDVENLIHQAKKYGIRIILDLVLNHTSDMHTWFQEAKKSKENPYHDYYVWRDGEEAYPPNDMKATFGGSAWEWVPECKQYYFHQFAVEQPDLNWENEDVRKELYEMIHWWIEKGAGGFRLDVIDQIAKEPDKKITINGPHLHTYMREMNREIFSKHDIVTVGETWGADVEKAKLFSNPNGSELSMVFQFEHICLDQIPGKEKWDLAPLVLSDLKSTMSKWQIELNGKGWNSLFWNNHDLPRIVSRWGNDGEYREQSAKMLATLLHCMQGTPYIYQGEELGMTNAQMKIEDSRDLETINMYQERKSLGYDEADIMHSIHVKGRDNARTPMQWDEGKHAGFSEVDPWIKVNPNHVKINAKEEMEDSSSIFNYYKKLIRMRKNLDVITEGDFSFLFESDESIFAYKREDELECMYVVCNFYEKEVQVDLDFVKDLGAKLILTNYEMSEDNNWFGAYEARVYYYKK
jgi:glucan 1,6-alpha-glucosidase